ncbi:hypothetical protein MMC08_006267 [Hypocenomyce scalaris]|nr:hypothetical protein [Hypocenomyce scalaris]
MSSWMLTTQRHATFASVTYHNAFPLSLRHFHDYFVTHLPSSSLHPDSRSSSGPHHQLPRSASEPHTPGAKGPSPAPLLGSTRETTVVRIPLRSAKHHFGVSVSRGTRPYNEDSYQAGVIELPAFAKPAPVSVTRAPASSPLQTYREGQRKERQKAGGEKETDGVATAAGGASGDPQVFYFGVFDGHGGAECSGFLREMLHQYIEDAAKKFELESSLKGREEKQTNDGKQKRGTQSVKDDKTSEDDADAGKGDKALVNVRMTSKDQTVSAAKQPQTDQDSKPQTAKKNQTPPPPSSPPTPQRANKQRVEDLQASILKGWRETVGGYFRRFQPSAFQPQAQRNPSATISAILTYAFLRADLDFITAQARKEDSDSDPVLSDAPLNASDILGRPSQSSARETGGSKRFKGGSTCSLALISTPTPTPFWHPSSPSTMVVAHVGDTRILLCRTSDGRAVPATTNHHPSTPLEANRLRRYAATFVTDSFGEERMSGLANTRSFGDISSKRIGVSAEPELRRLELSPAEYSFLVLVSDGVSGTLSDQEIVDVVKEARTPEQGAKDVVGFATEVSTEGDNATCLVVRLGGWERRGEGGGGSLGTREGREWRRREAGDPRSRRT